jgi:hypothetical protein
MIKIIGRKRYNTDTATEVATREHGMPGDFSYFQETLYRSRKGTWFIVGGGGPTSQYATSHSPGSYSGQSNVVTPFSDIDAYDWLERAGESALLEKYFVEKLEDA